MNITTDGNHSWSRLYKKCMEISQYIELCQHPAAGLFKCTFAWLLIIKYDNYTNSNMK